MQTLHFKTNINCNGCLAKVTPFLEGEKGIAQWQVDLQSDERILTVDTAMDAEEVIKTLQRSGFTAESMD